MFLISSEHIFKVNPFKFELLIQCFQSHALLPSASTSSEEKVKENSIRKPTVVGRSQKRAKLLSVGTLKISVNVEITV